MSRKMGTFHWIPKKDGRKRRIVVPTPHGKAANRHQLGLLHFLQQENCNPLVVHGFMRGKSPVTNAQRHIGYRWSVCFDLSDFFHSVTVQLFEKVVTDLSGGVSTAVFTWSSWRRRWPECVRAPSSRS